MQVVFCVLVQLLMCLDGNGLDSAENCTNERELKLNILSNNYRCAGCILGTIKICENGELRSFCDNDWTLEDATVACRTLGHSTEGVQNGFNPSASIPNPSSTGAVCSGDEASFSDCGTGDAFLENMNCGARLTLGCGPPVSAATTSPPHAAASSQEPAVIISQDTTAAKPLETTSSNSASASAVAGPTTAAIDSQDPQVDSQGFFGGPSLYIFIGGVRAAVVVAMLVLVQILLTFWCCYRHKAAVTPHYSTKECEESTVMKNEDLNDLGKKVVANPILSKSSGLEAPKFQLEQSPPKSSPAASDPTYETIA